MGGVVPAGGYGACYADGDPKNAEDREERVAQQVSGCHTVTGEERDRVFADMVAALPRFGGYQADVDRTIPVVVLSRR